MVTISKPEIAKLLKASKYEMAELTTPKKFENRVNKIYDAFMEMYNKPLVKSIKVKMTWHKSRTWGMNPSAEAFVEYVDGHRALYTDRIKGGTGYSKSTALIEKILRDHARQNLLHKRIVPKQEMKGVFWSTKLILPGYELGSASGNFFNFTITQTVSSENYDEYEIKFK